MADSVLGGAGGGAMKGASLGAQLGTAVMPGLGTAIGAVGGAVVGGVAGGVKSNKAKKQQETAQGFVPAYEDPTQIQRLAEIDQISKNIAAGTDPAALTASNQIANQTAQTQSKLARVTGGNAGATVDALIKSQRAGADATNTAISAGQSRLPFFKGLGQDLANRVEQRNIELKLLNRAQNSAEAAQAQKENVINRNATVASGIGVNELGQAINSPEAAAAKERIATLLNNMKIGQGDGVGTGAGMAPPAEMSSSLGITPEAAQGLSDFMNRGI